MGRQRWGQKQPATRWRWSRGPLLRRRRLTPPGSLAASEEPRGSGLVAHLEVVDDLLDAFRVGGEALGRILLGLRVHAAGQVDHAFLGMDRDVVGLDGAVADELRLDLRG